MFKQNCVNGIEAILSYLQSENRFQLIAGRSITLYSRNKNLDNYKLISDAR